LDVDTLIANEPSALMIPKLSDRRRRHLARCSFRQERHTDHKRGFGFDPILAYLDSTGEGELTLR
jgi:hypothetical protein